MWSLIRSKVLYLSSCRVHEKIFHQTDCVKEFNQGASYFKVFKKTIYSILVVFEMEFSNVEYLLKLKTLPSAISEIFKLAPLFSSWYEKVTELTMLSTLPSLECSDHNIYFYVFSN